MGRKRLNLPPPADAPPLCQRIDRLLKENWGNNITRMAGALGVSQTALARVLAGQMPGGKMLEGVMARPGVDAHWLLTGVGDPYVTEEASMTSRQTPAGAERERLTGLLLDAAAADQQARKNVIVQLANHLNLAELKEAVDGLRQAGVVE